MPASSEDAGASARIEDAASGFAIELPDGWSALRPRDPGWVDAYGDHESTAERDVASGAIQDFAVPLPHEPGDRWLNLTVYVQTSGRPEALEDVADRYEATLRGIDEIDDIRRRREAIPAGAAELLTCRRRYGLATRDTTRIFAWVVVRERRSYFLVFTSGADDVDRYEPIFRAAIATLRFL